MAPTQDWFDALVHESKAGLVRYLGRYFSSADDIQDVLQETYLKIYCALQDGRYKDHAPIALLYATAKNVAISRLRHRQVVARSIPAVTVAEELRREPRSAEQQVTRNEQRRQLMLVVNQLPPRCRDVFVCRMIEGLSQREIAERLDIAVSTVEKHLAKGLRLCKQAMSEIKAAERSDDPNEAPGKLSRRAGS